MAESSANGNQALAEAFANAAQRKSFFFEPPSRLQLVEKLEHLNRFSDFTLLVIGPQGAGKTTLLKRLADAENDRTLRVCHLQAETCPDLNSFLKQLSEQLSPQIVTETDNQQVLNGIYEYVQVMAAEHIQWVIIIDDAELLDNASLKLLLQMQSDAQGLLLKPHLLMAGSDRLLDKLKQSEEFSLLEAQVHQLTLEPFSATEAKDYLRQRYSAAESLSEKQLQTVFDTSEGYPGQLNIQAEELFRSGSITKPEASSGLPKNILAMVATVLLVVLGGALWQFWPAVEQSSERTRVQLQVPIEKENVPPATTSAPTTEITLNQPATFTPGQNDQPVRKSVEDEPPTTVVTDAKVSPPVSAPDQDVAAEVAQESAVKESEITSVKQPAVPEAKEPAPVVTAVSVAPAKEQSVTQPKQTETAVLSKAEQALLGWPESSYTLQVLGAGVRTSAEKFVRSQKEPQKFYLFRTTYKNKPWFVVVYGQYKDRTTASEASKKLPPELAKMKPWARSVQGIQADLATRK